MGKIKGLTNVTTPAAPSAPSFSPSPQQEKIFDFVRKHDGNAIIEAVAGSGKTTTLVEVCKHIPSGGSFLAFNKSIAVEIEAKLGAAGVSRDAVRASTFHAVGFQAWIRHAPRSGRNVKADKLSMLAAQLGVPKHLQGAASKLVSLAKQALIGAVCPIDDSEPWQTIVDHFDVLDLVPQGEGDRDEEAILEDLLAWSLSLLRLSIQRSDELIDFDDMLYMPLYTNLRFWQQDWVLVDEAQDTNLARRTMAERILRPGGRLIAVGDPHQAIYGFTGADADALDLLAEAFGCERLPLSVSYRCAQRIVQHAQQWVSHIEAAEGAPLGSVSELEARDFSLRTPRAGDAIICRNTQPIVKLAFKMLREHIPCHIEGRDIGAGLIALTKKWPSEDSIGGFEKRLRDYFDSERAKLKSAKKLQKLSALTDKVETMFVLTDGFHHNEPLGELRSLINRLFADSEPGAPARRIVLSTIHKAKGREWDRVFLWGRNILMPSPYAAQEWQLQQEDNLAYVAVTRAKTTLVEVNLEGGKER